MTRVATAILLAATIAGCSRPPESTAPVSPTPLVDVVKPGDSPKKTAPKAPTDLDPAAATAQEKAVRYVEGHKGKVKRAEGVVTEVDLSFKPVTDAELKELVPLTKLTALNLSYTQITDAGVRELAALKSLVTLSLKGTRVTGVGLVALAPLKNLTSLDMHVTHVTDAGLREIAALKNLTWLNVIASQWTEEGLKDLQRALPECKIISRPE